MHGNRKAGLKKERERAVARPIECNNTLYEKSSIHSKNQSGYSALGLGRRAAPGQQLCGIPLHEEDGVSRCSKSHKHTHLYNYNIYL